MASVTYSLAPSSSAAKFIRLSFLLLDLDFFSPPTRLMTQPFFCLLTQTTLFHRRPFRINFLCSLYSTTHVIFHLRSTKSSRFPSSWALQFPASPSRRNHGQKELPVTQKQNTNYSTLLLSCLRSFLSLHSSFPALTLYLSLSRRPSEKASYLICLEAEKDDLLREKNQEKSEHLQKCPFHHSSCYKTFERHQRRQSP